VLVRNGSGEIFLLDWIGLDWVLGGLLLVIIFLILLLFSTSCLSLEKRQTDVNAIAQALQNADLVQQYCSASVDISAGSGANVNVNVDASQSVTIPGVGSLSPTIVQQGMACYY
jgi:hypothetical protein